MNEDLKNYLLEMVELEKEASIEGLRKAVKIGKSITGGVKAAGAKVKAGASKVKDAVNELGAKGRATRKELKHVKERRDDALMVAKRRRGEAKANKRALRTAQVDTIISKGQTRRATKQRNIAIGAGVIGTAGAAKIGKTVGEGKNS